MFQSSVLYLLLVVLGGRYAFADVAVPVSPPLWSGFEADFGKVDAGCAPVSPVTETPAGWFQVQKLPGGIYGFMEHGHSEMVNSFLIPGAAKDVLYDTGMGIASIREAIDFVRAREGLPSNPIMVINSHAHLDHVGGNREFESVHVFKDPWTTDVLGKGIQPGTWTAYYAALLPPPAPRPPAGFDPALQNVPPLAWSKLRYLEPGQRIDLGNKVLRVLKTTSHTSADVVLYEEAGNVLFTGDAFTPIAFLANNLKQFERDVTALAELPLNCHFNTHGPLVINTAWLKRVSEAMRAINEGDYLESTTDLFGLALPTYAHGDVHRIVDARKLLSSYPEAPGAQ
ncbi:MBL fold metallo-hydrolase [Parahaliea maris]|uniref:MBL fold metallo-hydrolase n=1 Tax=Parahaliea maris TaxID=2716870 RepID=A0A5C8ZWF9_9GAMM|nr:MBL fold metallo-hydrolase [Parahaliea maris]TXS92768.1 MBL fold metallo-hydrolase [Parahaliea maris]